MMTPNEIDKLQKECEYEALKEKVERLEKLDMGTNKDTITISMEEYKELLMIKGKYEELKSQQILKPSYTGIRDLSERYTIPESPYKITCKEEL